MCRLLLNMLITWSGMKGDVTMKSNSVFKYVSWIAILVLVATGCGGGPATATVAPATEPPGTETPATEEPTEAPTEAPTSGERILGLSLFSKDDSYMQGIETGAQKAADELGVILEVRYSDANEQTQIDQMNELISIPVNAVLVYPMTDNTETSGAAAANQAGIPFFALGFTSSNSDVKVVSLIRDAFPPNPETLGDTAVRTAVDYLNGKPVDEVVQVPLSPTVTLPDDVQGTIVEPPVGQVWQAAKNELEAAMQESGIELANYRTDAVMLYPEPDVEKAEFIAAPRNQGFETFPLGEPVMVWYDRQNAYSNGSLVYEVSFYDGTNQICAGVGPVPCSRLYNPSMNVEVILEASYKDQGTPLAATWAFCVVGSCWGCVCSDSQCWCLICRKS